MTGTYRFKTGFYGVTDMPTEFQKAMDRTLDGCLNSLCYLDDVLVCSVGTAEQHNELTEAALLRLYNEGFSLKLSNCFENSRKLTTSDKSRSTMIFMKSDAGTCRCRFFVDDPSQARNFNM